LRGCEAGTSPFLCTYRTHVAGTVRKLVHTKRILVHFYVVAGTVCKNSAHDAALKLRSFCPCFMTHEFKPVEFHAKCSGDKILSPQQNFFAKTGMSHEQYLGTEHVCTPGSLHSTSFVRRCFIFRPCYTFVPKAKLAKEK